MLCWKEESRACKTTIVIYSEILILKFSFPGYHRNCQRLQAIHFPGSVVHSHLNELLQAVYKVFINLWYGFRKKWFTFRLFVNLQITWKLSLIKAKNMVNQADKEISFDFFINEVLHAAWCFTFVLSLWCVLSGILCWRDISRYTLN